MLERLFGRAWDMYGGCREIRVSFMVRVVKQALFSSTVLRSLSDFIVPSCCRKVNFFGVDQSWPKDEHLHTSCPKKKPACSVQLIGDVFGRFEEGLRDMSGALWGRCLEHICDYIFGLCKFYIV